MSKRLENRVFVITGAAMGLGQATAMEAAKEGARYKCLPEDSPLVVIPDNITFEEAVGNVIIQI